MTTLTAGQAVEGGVAGKNESLPEAVDPKEVEIAFEDNMGGIGQKATEAIRDYYERCSPGEKLSAVLLHTLLCYREELGNELLTKLRESLTMASLDEDPDGHYLGGLVHGLILGS